jgi:hypothetical protein
MTETSEETKLKIIAAGRVAIEQLIKVAKEDILKSVSDSDSDSKDLTADKLKNAAATKKLAIFDAFEILSRIESEQETLDSIKNGSGKTDTKQGFAERNSRK